VVTEFDSTPATKVLGYLSVVTHLEPFTKGLLDVKEVVYFLSAIFLGLFLTAVPRNRCGGGHKMNSVGSKQAQTKFSGYVTLYILVIVAVLAAANYLANQHDASYDSTKNKLYSLSNQTDKVVKGLKQDVAITYFDRSTEFSRARDLLAATPTFLRG